MSYNVAMKERYRLVFRGEVLEGQHTAVVKRRLGQTLELTDDKLEELFSGKLVIIRKDADAETAGEFQRTFKKTGAKLRAVRIAEKETAPTQTAKTARSEAIAVLPVGADVLTPDERVETPPVDIDTEHLEIGEAQSGTPEPSSEPAPPDVSHISVAEVGEDLTNAQDEETIEIDVDFDLAELGSLVGDPQPEPEPAVDMDQVDFDVAEPGTAILEEQAIEAPPQPDTSHIQLEKE